MDRLIYTAMTGAKHAFLQQAGVANNLANASTTGYRAMEHRFRAVPVQGEGAPTRQAWAHGIGSKGILAGHANTRWTCGNCKG